MKQFLKILLLYSVMALSFNEAQAVKLTEIEQTIGGVYYQLFLNNQDEHGVPIDPYCYARCVLGTPEIVTIPAEVEYESEDLGIGSATVVDVICDRSCPAKIVNFPATVRRIVLGSDMLEEVHVDSENPVFSTIDGMLLTKDGKRLLQIPGGRKNIVVPEGVVNIGDNNYDNNECIVWSDSPSLEAISFPSTCKRIGKKALYNCKKLRTVIMGKAIESIDDGAFSNCIALKETVLPKSLVSLGYHCFCNCTALEEIILPKSLVSLGTRCFDGCLALTTIDVESDNPYFQSLDGVLFSKDGKILKCYPPAHSTEYNVPTGTERIDDYSFAGVIDLEKVVFPPSLRTVGEYAFAYVDAYYWSRKIQFEFNEGLESIEKGAFYNCREASVIKLPSSLKAIGKKAFCFRWSKLICKAVTPPECEKEALYYGISLDSRKVVVPVKSLSLYKNSSEWENLPIVGVYSKQYSSFRIKSNAVFQNEIGTAIDTDADAIEGLVWTSNNPEIAYVNESNLIISMGKPGRCILSLIYEDEVVDSFYLTVEDPDSIIEQKTYISEPDEAPSERRIVIDGISSDQRMLNVHLEPSMRSDVLTWSSSDESIASIDHGIINFHDPSQNVTFTVADSSGHTATIEYQGQTGVTSITSDDPLLLNNSQGEQIYNLQGIPVTNPTPGIYIHRIGSHTSTILIK